MNRQIRDDLTILIRRWAAGEPGAADQAIPLLHDELRRIAVGYLRRERREHTLQPTAVVNEAWVQLLESNGIQQIGSAWESRVHFFGVAARVMRRVLVDHGRARHAAKRGGGRSPLRLCSLPELPDDRALEVQAVDLALRDLERVDVAGARLVELRFFGGLTIDEAATFLGLSRKATVRRWRRVRAWLHSQLDGARVDERRHAS